jgi:hypothetical protein
VSEALNHTLIQVRLRLERGLQLAEQELAETRERCTMAEVMIRSIRAQGSELALLRRPEAVVKLQPVPDGAVVKTPEAAAGAEPAPEAAHEEGSTVTEIPTSYMPMLEELWEIARDSDPE